MQDLHPVQIIYLEVFYCNVFVMKIVPCNGLQAVAYTDGRNVLLRSQMDIDAVATVIHRGKGNENVYSMQWSPVDKLPLLAVMTCNEGNTKKIGKNEEDCCCVYVYRVAIRPFNSSGTKTETGMEKIVWMCYL